MRAHSPEEVHRLFAKAFNAGDVEALVGLYEPEAVLVPQAGARATGRDAIRRALAGFLSAFNTIELKTGGIVERDGIALVYSDFTLHGTGTDGQPTTLVGHGTEIMRRHTYSGWLFAIDDPFSTA
jgi:uncharacterized protein (TIGR02246 family)